MDQNLRAPGNFHPLLWPLLPLRDWSMLYIQAYWFNQHNKASIPGDSSFSELEEKKPLSLSWLSYNIMRLLYHCCNIFHYSYNFVFQLRNTGLKKCKQVTYCFFCYCSHVLLWCISWCFILFCLFLRNSLVLSKNPNQVNEITLYILFYIFIATEFTFLLHWIKSPWLFLDKLST